MSDGDEENAPEAAETEGSGAESETAVDVEFDEAAIVEAGESGDAGDEPTDVDREEADGAGVGDATNAAEVGDEEVDATGVGGEETDVTDIGDDTETADVCERDEEDADNVETEGGQTEDGDPVGEGTIESPDPAVSGADTKVPLEELRQTVASETDATAVLDDVFEREAVGDIDPDALWTDLEREDSPYTAVLDSGDDRDVHEVSKAQYCQRCEYFSEPPEVACSHEGTDILEMPTSETFRVADCPLVAEEAALEADRSED